MWQGPAGTIRLDDARRVPCKVPPCCCDQRIIELSTANAKTWPKLTSADEFRFLADLVLKRSEAHHTVVNLHDQHGGTTRFANSRVVQNVDTRRGTLTVTVAFDRQHGSASTTDFSAGAIQDVLARAERIARVSPEDPEYLPPPEPQRFPT